MNNYNKNYYAVIMAGGVGSRFWPVSTSKFPKQFHDMLGVGETLLQRTFNRLTNTVPYENILILTNDEYLDLVQQQLPEITKDQIILEPAMRNTAPCILLAALKIKKKNPDAIMLVAPSDHWIQDDEAFANDIKTSFEAVAENDMLITLGIKPTFANTGYGYIQFKEEADKCLQKVVKFTEKPTLRNARKFLEEGNYLWNAGIFIWKASFISDSFLSYLPEMFHLFNEGYEELNSKRERAFINETYPKAQNISIDYAIMEKSDSVYLIPASFDWNDLGTWGALHSELAKDDYDNAVVNSSLIPMESKGNMVYTHKHKVVVLDGLEDYIVVDDEEVLLIVPKEKEQDIKNIRESVIKKHGENLG
ncbi:mannose-1-phosphate guanylyltransferase [Gillisia sp. M10.2A]|uniref:Mannose-1-phosphate guanylyltransferase n=1 Tax=Gillisia lutea TaxID=2909668 RepID=A0ABS9EH71_9FLAO|nr:mannose-1-phosphate guanylyltransferase [Gillisia lutea]MCF4102227.1 mannose-1-phosphate guanylyltransferase [Gillisia lutea]